MESKVKIYTSQRMTGRECIEMRVEADMLERTLTNHGYEVLNPVIAEGIPYTHEILKANPETIEQHWKRDKEMMRDADILVDYQTNNLSDGTNKELAYTRFCLWKPTVRIVRPGGFAISKLEDDIVVESLNEGIRIIGEKFGSYEKLANWRRDMLTRCFDSWLSEQTKMNKRYGISVIKELV
jgi:hypothetical protein